jgi:hypothetical protein
VRHVALFLSLATALVAGCSFSVGTGSKTTAGEGESSGSGSGSDSGGTTSAPAAKVSAESKAWFKECSAHYDDFMSKWKAIDDEAKAAIDQTKDGDFYPGAAKLTAQITKTCVAAKATGWPLQYANNQGTGLALQVALAKLQLKGKKGGVQLFDTVQFHDMARNLPTTGDAEFDRNAFCLMVQNNNGIALPAGSSEARFAPMGGVPYNTAHWMTDAELKTFNDKFSALTKDANDTLIGLDKQLLHTAGEVGRVKSVKKNPDGSTTITAKRVEAPYECAHTGNYHWDGAGYNDCTYVDKAPVEIYGFTAHFSEVPPGDLKAGDFVGFQGQVNGKAPSNVEMADAKWEAHIVNYVMRAKKMVFQISRIEVCR